MDHQILFYGLLFLVAFLYASVGHGGASGYLALMAIFSISPDVMKPTALMLNLFVSLTSFYQFYRGKHFQWKIFLPLALASVPMAFLGGLVSVDASIYKKLLGLLLLLPIIRFLFFRNITAEELKKPDWGLSLLIGAAIGFLSGLIGIGGGIIHVPVLIYLLGFPVHIATATSHFVLAISTFSGSITHLTLGNILYIPALVVGLCAVAGAQIGARLSRRVKGLMIARLLAIALILVGVRLLLKALGVM